MKPQGHLFFFPDSFRNELIYMIVCVRIREYIGNSYINRGQKLIIVDRSTELHSLPFCTSMSSESIQYMKKNNENYRYGGYACGI